MNGGTHELLDVSALTAGYSHTVPVIWDVSLRVHSGELVGLLGANGSGKSTLLRAIAGLCELIDGRVLFERTDLTRASAATRVARGVVLVPQGYALFSGLTVEEHLLMGAWAAPKDVYEARLAEVVQLLPKLAQRHSQLVDSLSGGERAMVAIGRGLMAGPRLLLLDEPSLGLSPTMRLEVLSAVKNLCENRRLGCIVCEQDVSSLARVASYWHVLRAGRIVHTGAPESTSADELRDLFLGLATSSTLVEG